MDYNRLSLRKFLEKEQGIFLGKFMKELPNTLITSNYYWINIYKSLLISNIQFIINKYNINASYMNNQNLSEDKQCRKIIKSGISQLCPKIP